MPIIDVSGISADSDGALKVVDYMTRVKKRIQAKTTTLDNVLSIVKSAAEQLLQIPVRYEACSERIAFCVIARYPYGTRNI